MSMTESKKKIALVCGISGQDGSYLAQFLLNTRAELCAIGGSMWVKPD